MAIEINPAAASIEVEYLPFPFKLDRFLAFDRHSTDPVGGHRDHLLVTALPLAAGVFAPWGILLSPAIGAVLMSVSTIIVAINAQLLRGQRLAA